MSEKDGDFLKSLVLVGQLGFVIIIPLIGSILLARFLTGHFGNDLAFLLGGIAIGLYLGFRNAYLMMIKK